MSVDGDFDALSNNRTPCDPKTFRASVSAEFLKMGAEIRTTQFAQKEEYGWNVRKGSRTAAAFDDDDVDPPGAGSSPAVKSVTTPHLRHAHLGDSDDDSLFSEFSSEVADRLSKSGSALVSGKTQALSSDSYVDAWNSDQERTAALRMCSKDKAGPVYGVESTRNRCANLAGMRQGDVSTAYDESNDGGDLESDDIDERSRLMAAAQDASIPSNDSSSDDSDIDKRMMAVAQAVGISSNDCSGKGDNDVHEKSRLTAAAQAAELSSDDSFSDHDTVVRDRFKLMAAAQAASIPSDDSLSDESEDGLPKTRSMSTMSKVRTKTPTTDSSVSTLIEAPHISENLEVDDYSSFSGVESSDSEGSYSTDEVTKKDVFDDQKKAAIVPRKTEGSNPKKFSRNSAVAAGEEDDSEDGSNSSERSDYGRGNDGNHSQKRDVNSASFPRNSTFKWSNVKTKTFYSFRALKASASSSSDGSRTISVKNLAREVTEDRLHDFFKDSGTILDIWIVRDAQSGLSSAYVEFESGISARKAVQKSGKKLEGRVILCDTAYENSRGGYRSGPGSDWASIDTRIAESYAALKLFDPKLQEGDAKFLSRFNEPTSFRQHAGDTLPSGSGNSESVQGSGHPRRSGDCHFEGERRRKESLPWTNSSEGSVLSSGRIQSELGFSVCVKNLELVDCSSIVRQKLQESWRKRKGRFRRFHFSWKWARWQPRHFVRQTSSSWAQRRPCGIIDTDEKKVARSAVQVNKLKRTHPS